MQAVPRNVELVWLLSNILCKRKIYANYACIMELLSIVPPLTKEKAVKVVWRAAGESLGLGMLHEIFYSHDSALKSPLTLPQHQYLSCHMILE